MHLLIVKKDIENARNQRTIKKGEVYFVEDQNVKAENAYVKYVPIEQVFKPFDPNDKHIKNVILTRAGGIGDILALSSIVNTLSDYNIHFYTQSKFAFLFAWFTIHPMLHEHTAPILRDYRYNKDFGKLKSWAFINFSNLIEKGARENWFEIFFNSAKLDFKPELGRPSLSAIPAILNSNFKSALSGIGSVLLCPSSTAQMRSMKLEDLHKISCDMYKDKKYFINEIDLRPGDVDYCIDNNIIIMPNNGLERSFIDLYYYDHVMCTDTMHLHFREGIGKSATGFYSSFSSSARTKYYKYTQSIDVKSECELQPCFLHENVSGVITKKCNKSDSFDYAPCLDYKYLKNSI